MLPNAHLHRPEYRTHGVDRLVHDWEDRVAALVVEGQQYLREVEGASDGGALAQHMYNRLLDEAGVRVQYLLPPYFPAIPKGATDPTMALLIIGLCPFVGTLSPHALSGLQVTPGDITETLMTGVCSPNHAGEQAHGLGPD